MPAACLTWLLKTQIWRRISCAASATCRGAGRGGSGWPHGSLPLAGLAKACRPCSAGRVERQGLSRWTEGGRGTADAQRAASAGRAGHQGAQGVETCGQREEAACTHRAKARDQACGPQQHAHGQDGARAEVDAAVQERGHVLPARHAQQVGQPASGESREGLGAKRAQHKAAAGYGPSRPPTSTRWPGAGGQGTPTREGARQKRHAAESRRGQGAGRAAAPTAGGPCAWPWPAAGRR